jgi:hypothetical protein
MKTLWLRVSIYLVLIPLAVIAIVPNGFDTLQLLAQGEITFADIAPGVARAVGKLTKTSRLARSDQQAVVPLTDLGNGAYSLSTSAWGGNDRGAQMQARLHDQAARFCATRQAAPHVTQSSHFDSTGYNDADLTFWCEGTVAAHQADEWARLDAELVATRGRLVAAIDALDEPLREPNRDKLQTLGRQNMDMLKLSGEAKMQRMREMIALHQALLREIARLKTDAAQPVREQGLAL